MPLNAVLFDMDGVIVDTEPLHRKAYFKTFEDLNINVSDELYASYAGASTKKVCLSLIDIFGLKETPEEITTIKRTYFKEYFDTDENFALIPGVLDLIQHYHANNINLVLASSASMNTIQWVFDKFNLHSYFIGKISGADLKASKPHPEIFLKAAEIANEPTTNCMVIEDSTNGIQAAYSAGIFCAAYRSIHTHGQEYSKAQLVVSNYAELYTDKIESYFK